MNHEMDSRCKEVWVVRDPLFCSDALNPALPVSPWAGHRNFAYDLVAYLKPSRILELGTHYGCSFFAFLQASKDLARDTEHFAVDTWLGEEHAGLYGEEVFELVGRTVKECFPNQKVRILRKTFDEALADVADGSIDLLHIDGFHSYEAVRHDFTTWLPKLSGAGVVLFHDIAPSSGYGSATYWNEIKTQFPHFEFLEHSFGLGVLFPKECVHYVNLKKYLDFNVLDLYRYKAELQLKSRQYCDAQRQLVERWTVLESMERMIRERDEAIESQAQMLEQRWAVMQSMEKIIRELDETTRASGRVPDVLRAVKRWLRRLVQGVKP